MIPIRCTACGGLSQIDEAWLGRQVQCPHCENSTEAVSAAAATAAPLPPPPPSGAPVGRPVPPPPETPALSRRPEPTAAPINVVATKGRETPVTEPREPARPSEPPLKRRPLTRAEREAIRRRRHLILAIGGGVILLVAALVLFALSPPLVD